jgi:ABC-type branched-subunit amino acid transport system substrate-binding protein
MQVTSDKWQVTSDKPRIARITFRYLLLATCTLFLVTCAFPGSVKPTVKIGLAAPFEGLYRDLGYEVLHAVRLAVRQWNEAGGVGDRYLVELVALNDFDEPAEAVQQAREMAADPGVLGVLGGWSAGTASAAAPEYERLDLAFLFPETDWSVDYFATPRQVPDDPAFVAAYEELSGGAPPGAAATWAYAAANRLLDAIDAAVRVAASRAGGTPTRDEVQATLTAEARP